MVKLDEVIFFPSHKKIEFLFLLTITGRIQGQYQLELRRDRGKGYIIRQNWSYTLKSTNNNYSQCCNVVR